MLLNWLIDFKEYFINTVSTIQIIDIVDILIVSVLLYYVFIFIRDRRAAKLTIGVVFLLIFLLVSQSLKMNALNFLLRNIVQVGTIALIIVFQPELRSALEKMGGRSLKGLGRIGEKETTEIKDTIGTVVRTANDFSQSKTGALIVFECGTKLGDIIKSGTVLNADMSLFLLKNIFFDKAPLHDGAVIISNNKIYAAGCFLPLSENSDIFKDLGTRHRAAIGMSENSDAVVVVVSEETGQISIARDGVLRRMTTSEQAREELEKIFLETLNSKIKKTTMLKNRQ